MTTRKRFAVFDGDSHVVEPRDVWETYLEPEYRVLGKYALWREDGKTNAYLKVNGEMHRDTMPSNIPRHAIWRPGMTWDTIGELDPQTRHAMNEGAWEPQARLRDMDAMGVDQALLYPTWFAEGFHLVHDPDVAYALARAYNNWITDFCQAAPDRPFFRKNQGSAPSSAAHWRWRRALCRRREWPARGSLLFRNSAARTSSGADPVLLVGQSHVRRVHIDRLYGDATVSQDEGSGGARQSLVDGGGSREDGGLHAGDPPPALLSRA